MHNIHPEGPDGDPRGDSCCIQSRVIETKVTKRTHGSWLPVTCKDHNIYLSGSEKFIIKSLKVGALDSRSCFAIELLVSAALLCLPEWAISGAIFVWWSMTMASNLERWLLSQAIPGFFGTFCWVLWPTLSNKKKVWSELLCMTTRHSVMYA